jgi:hypothetical protein
VPALWSFVKIRSFRCALEPFVEFNRHRRKELPLVHSIPSSVPGRHGIGHPGRSDPDSRHGLADGVDYLFGNSLGFFGTRLSLLEAGVKLWQILLRRFLSFAAASGMGRIGSLALSLFHGCHMRMLAETGSR